MALQAKSIIRRVVGTLQDDTSVRWPVAELVRYLNDGQREVVLYRPDSLSTNATIDCVAGSKQTLPSNGAKLIEVVRNAASGSNFRAIRMINREVLDAQLPNWHAIPPVDTVKHFMYDPRDPRVFYVYPPATTDAKLDIVYASYPQDIAEPADGATAEDVVGNIALPDIYGNVLIDYVLYRAYSKDSEYAGNANRAQAHYGAFTSALGVELQATVGTMPNPVGNPNQPQMSRG